MARNYSNIAIDTTLSAGIDASVTTITVASATGWPSAPFAAVLDPGGTEEVVQVTAKAGTSWTVTRGFDGTTAAAHSSGVTVRHAAIAGDFTDLQAADATNAAAVAAEATARSNADAAHANLTTTAHGGLAAIAGNQSANQVFAGPASGGAAAPTFRALVVADLPSGIALLGSANAFTAAQSIAANTAGSLLGVTQSGNGAAIQVDNFGNGSAMTLFSYGGGPAFFAFSFTTLSYVADVVRLYRGMYGGSNPADGFGSQLTFELEDDSHTARVATAFESTLATAAAASWKGRYRLLVGDSGGSREVLRGQGTGGAAAIGFLGASATAREAVSADATDLASAIVLVNDLKAKLITKGLVA